MNCIGTLRRNPAALFRLPHWVAPRLVIDGRHFAVANSVAAKKTAPARMAVPGPRKPFHATEAAHNSLRPFVAGFRRHSGAAPAFQRKKPRPEPRLRLR